MRIVVIIIGKKLKSLDLSKEMGLELGKINFIGIMGEFLIIKNNFF